MTRLRIPALSAVVVILMLSLGACTTMESEPNMSALSSPVTDEKSDGEVAADYKAEASRLREKAEEHRKMGRRYKARHISRIDSLWTYRHCEKLARHYERAAKEADAIASELSK
jgi:hypothetical protein